MRRVFWDTMLFIYLLEEHSTYSLPVQALFENALMSGDSVLASSLTYGEAMVGIQRFASPVAFHLRQALFALPFDVVDFNQECIEPFAALRNGGMKTADAINLACAVTAKADVFVTNDKELKTKAGPMTGRVLMLAEALDSYL